jgi:hypothetical protein
MVYAYKWIQFNLFGYLSIYFWVSFKMPFLKVWLRYRGRSLFMAFSLARVCLNLCAILLVMFILIILLIYSRPICSFLIFIINSAILTKISPSTDLENLINVKSRFMFAMQPAYYFLIRLVLRYLWCFFSLQRLTLAILLILDSFGLIINDACWCLAYNSWGWSLFLAPSFLNLVLLDLLLLLRQALCPPKYCTCMTILSRVTASCFILPFRECFLA